MPSRTLPNFTGHLAIKPIDFKPITTPCMDACVSDWINNFDTASALAWLNCLSISNAVNTLASSEDSCPSLQTPSAQSSCSSLPISATANDFVIDASSLSTIDDELGMLLNEISSNFTLGSISSQVNVAFPPTEQFVSPKEILPSAVEPAHVESYIQDQKRRRKQACASRRWRAKRASELNHLQVRTTRLADEKGALEKRAAILESNARMYLQRELEMMRRVAYLEAELVQSNKAVLASV
ncbi:hypothetical protein HDU98_006712 [Podochytrium sp. JEL0797]|nr:hypothetical protein HDU98_006712 [Podochytrium sp. JEL0797]